MSEKVEKAREERSKAIGNLLMAADGTQEMAAINRLDRANNYVESAVREEALEEAKVRLTSMFGLRPSVSLGAVRNMLDALKLEVRKP